MAKTVALNVKQTCCKMREDRYSNRYIYENYYTKAVDDPMSFRSFSTSMFRWSKKNYADQYTLDAGTYEGFTAHGATVQVNADGEIERVWVKQHADDFDPDAFIEALKGNVEKYEPKPVSHTSSKNMLEIPLFDMHWGIAYMDYYEDVLDDVCNIIRSRRWKRILIPFGQDFFHNDSIVRGETTKGTQIEKVDMVRAVKDGKKFICTIIDLAIEYADDVKVVYSPGNHDKSTSWMFMQMLLERYGESIVDDKIIPRRVFTYGSNAIMVTHGNAKKANSKNLAHVFPVMFPEEFAGATTREVHAGHLHHENDSDVFGIMVRRLSSGTKTDGWSDEEDHVGAHKRFELFDWSLDKLNAIYYI